jgi:putative oxidoreductase
MPPSPPKGRTITIWTLRILLGVLFLAVGTSKLTGTANTIDFFAAIGWGKWLRYLTGTIDIVGALLLFFSRSTFYGAVAIACSVGTGALLSFELWRTDPTTWSPGIVVVPLIPTFLVVSLAWLTRPRHALTSNN